MYIYIYIYIYIYVYVYVYLYISCLMCIRVLNTIAECLYQ